MLRLRRTWPDSPDIFTVIYPLDGYDYRVGSIALATGVYPHHWTWVMNMLVQPRLPLTTSGSAATREGAMQGFRAMWESALPLIAASDFDRARASDAATKARDDSWFAHHPPAPRR